MKSNLNSLVLGMLAFASLGGVRAVSASTVVATTNENQDAQALKGDVDDAHRDHDSNACAPISIEVVVKRVAYESPIFAGIGFYSNFAIGGRSSPFYTKGELSPSRLATLKGGEAAVVLTFTGKGYCWQGDMTSSETQQDIFKPYAKFQYTDPATGDVHQITNWDSGPNRILGMQWPPFGPRSIHFDRSTELLQ